VILNKENALPYILSLNILNKHKMTSSYESICEELDSLAVLYLTKLNEYSHEWKNTANEIQQVRNENKKNRELHR
jgi:hypothetical protein